MMGSSHLASGVLVWATGCEVAAGLGVTVHPVTVAVGCAACGLGALLPDLDHPKSLATRLLGPVTMLLSWILRRFVHHRGQTHYLAAALVPMGLTNAVVAPVAPGWWWVGTAVGAGYLVHLAGDCLTLSGVPLLGPVSDRSFGVWWPLRFRAGGRVELLIVKPLMVAWAVGLVWHVTAG